MPVKSLRQEFVPTLHLALPLAFAELGLAKLEDAALAILRQGDPTHARRSELASELGKKASAERYAAFLDLAPSLIAREARRLEGGARGHGSS